MVDRSDLPDLGALLGQAYLHFVLRRAFSALVDISTCSLQFLGGSAAQLTACLWLGFLNFQ